MSYFKGIVLFVITFQFALAQCQIEDVNTLWSAIKENHPVLKKHGYINHSYSQKIEDIRKVKNPSLEIEALQGSSDSKEFELSAKITQTIELGNKRSKRYEVAKYNSDLVSLNNDKEKEDLMIDLVKNIYHLRQLIYFLPVYKESLHSFNLIKNKLKKLSTLSPEQQIELETLELVISDYDLKHREMKVTVEYLKKHLGYFAGLGCVVDKKNLPDVLAREDINSKSKNLRFAQLNMAKKNLELQEANVRLQKSLAYSDLEVGPIFEMAKVQDGIGSEYASEKKVGIALSFDLPIYNRNQGQRASSLTQLKLAKYSLDKLGEEASLDLSTWKIQYSKYISALENMPTRNDLEKKHQKIEKLFKRGIISTSMIIESHRQLIENTVTRNNFELGAVEALWNIAKYTGEIHQKLIERK